MRQSTLPPGRSPEAGNVHQRLLLAMSFFHWILGILNATLVIVTVAHALLIKRDPRASWGWISVCFLFPIGGPMFYLLFGINRVRTRAKRLTNRLPFMYYFTHAHPDIRSAVKWDEQLPADFQYLARISDSVTRRPLVKGNKVELLHNGEQVYPAMLDAINGAKKSLYLSTYILDSNVTGRRFISSLAEARKRGLDVRVLIDGVGEYYSRPRSGRLLEKQGIPVARYLPPTLFPPSLHINLRNHRKILVADGETAFVGGMNIGDRHLAENLENPLRVIDLHFRTTGPVVRQIEEVFIEDWAFVTGEEEVPPPSELAPEGTTICRTIVDGPNEDLDTLATILVGAVSAARRRILIMTPYFLPSREMIGALQSAVLRGVEVTVLLPVRNNLPFVHWATQNMLWELLQWGVRIYYQPPPFVHSKLFVVDNYYAQLGSSNMDPRSLRLNFELAVEAFDRGLVQILAEFVEQCRSHSTEVLLKDVDSRPLPVKVRDSLAWLFSPYM